MLIDTIKDLASKQAADPPHEKGRFDEGEPQFRFAFANRVVHKQVLRLLLVAGKGGETYQEIMGVRHIYNDIAAVRGAIECAARGKDREQ